MEAYFESDLQIIELKVNTQLRLIHKVTSYRMIGNVGEDG